MFLNTLFLVVKMKSSDLGDLIKKNCVAVFKDGFYPDKPFESSEEHRVMWGICEPVHNFSSWNVFLPRVLRAIVRQDESVGSSYATDGLYVFHYGVMDNLRKKIAQVVPDKDEQVLYEQYFRRKYGDASCLLTTLGVFSMIVGDVEKVQQAVDHCKVSEANYFALMRCLMRRNMVDLWRVEAAHKVHVYDFVKKPNYVKHEW